MRCFSENNRVAAFARYEGFSLPEVMAALVILAFVSSSVLVVLDRCMASAADLRVRMQAFEVARENMERLLASDSVEEMVEYGDSEMYPEIQWQTVVETFQGPDANLMWVRAVCSADYIDVAGETQKVELTHWLTYLTEEQMVKFLEAQAEDEKLLEEAGQIIDSPQAAAEYAGVDAETVRQWVEKGMRTTKSGYYIKSELELFERTDGTGKELPSDFDAQSMWPAEEELQDAEDF
jgi:prepilin-type N-terminal cleavage/methylation domain-containing protein